MANQIRITPDQMRTRANEYRTEAETVNGVIQKMDSLLGQLQSEWEGAASESCAARYQELKPGFMKAEELIREIATALDSTARIVEPHWIPLPVSSKKLTPALLISSGHKYATLQRQRNLPLERNQQTQNLTLL